MRSSRDLKVVVVCVHPLLGEGIVRLLATEQGIDVCSIPARDPEAASRVLAVHPDVVIFEPAELLHAIDLPGNAPQALLIDVSMCPGPVASAEVRRSGPDEILRVLRRARTGSLRRADPASTRAS